MKYLIAFYVFVLRIVLLIFRTSLAKGTRKLSLVKFCIETVIKVGFQPPSEFGVQHVFAASLLFQRS